MYFKITSKLTLELKIISFFNDSVFYRKRNKTAERIEHFFLSYFKQVVGRALKLRENVGLINIKAGETLLENNESENLAQQPRLTLFFFFYYGLVSTSFLGVMCVRFHVPPHGTSSSEHPLSGDRKRLMLRDH